MSEIPYASMIRSIMYAMICTCLDVSFALSVTRRYQSCLGEDHWIAVMNILKYMRRTKDTFLEHGGKEELVVKGYTDAGFLTDKDYSISQTGSYSASIVERLVGRVPNTVADSATEAEYIAASEAAKEAVWIRKFVSELVLFQALHAHWTFTVIISVPLHKLRNLARSHQKSKHIFRRYHLIREIIDRGDVKICKVHTDLNVADPLTKPLPQSKFEAHKKAMGIGYLS
ncbi:LOW QUALITY PROTEIN: hypothetical protein U9M48_028226 [Paspalum notatum var. saurae]|uniref:Gag/pol protein n=1 Tax=Paspalum notatum var. saurae TaxID=547442 RepID=A0AAQ3X037_PASNO